jgi:hypothetical protein
LLVASVPACAADFDTSRPTPTRGSVGRELFGLVCDRVGAQALREDVTSASYHGICHADADGKYEAKVDQTKLVALDPSARDVDGEPVSLDDQKKHRAYRVARIETLGLHREELVAAFDTMLPDVEVATDDLLNPSPEKTCDQPIDPKARKSRLLRELADTLARFVDLYNDDTIPMVTGALGRMMIAVENDKGVQAALARMDARQGYRPAGVAIGVARPALAYPRLVDLVNSLSKVLASNSDPYREDKAIVPGAAAQQFQDLLHTMHEELRTATSDPPLGPLKITTDSKLGRELLSRPRSTLEITRAIMLAEDDKFGLSTTIPRFIVRRDSRAFASVATDTSGKLPAPFVDGDSDGLPDLDKLGRFVTMGGNAPTPFFTAFGEPGADGKRDSFGRALKLDSATDPLYRYVDTSRTFAASLVKDLRVLVDPHLDDKGVSMAPSTVMKLLTGVPVVLGNRDDKPTSERTYPADPSLVDAWTAARTDPPPKNLGTQPVTLKYRGFQAETSPMVDLVYALGQIMAKPEVDDTLVLFRKLIAERPDLMARLVGVGLQLKAIADKHPEAKLPENSLLWDEVLDTVAKIAQTPGILEDLLKAFGDDRTKNLQTVFAAYIKYKDELTYDRNDLNGPPMNLTAGGKTGLVTPVDRSKPDSGNNRSALQRFMQLLHDANGLAACTKDNAVAHIELEWPSGSGIKVKVNYPTDFLSDVICAFVGESAPKKLPQCGVLRFDNVAALLLDVALNRAKFDVRDKCLNKLMSSPLTAIVGGTDAFLENASGIKGFNTHPTVPGIARFVFFDTAHDGLPGDTVNAKTNTFLNGVLDPVPSTVCPLTPFTDPSDGKVFNLRKCSSFADTIRGRDNNALFPLELLDFVKNVGPLAASFADHGKPLYFVELFDTLHLHWGSKAQTKAECDPTLPRTDARWCAQDGAVTYEALLGEMLETDLFETLQALVTYIQAQKVSHCNTYDPTTHTCITSTDRDGLAVLADAVRVLVDPTRSVGLTDRRGNVFAVRNDGNKNPQVTPLYLFIDALKGIDKAFATGDGKRLAPWREARSELVDQLFAVDGAKGASSFKNQAVPKVLPLVIDIVRAQIAAHCPDPSMPCTWASKDLAASLEKAISGPTAATSIDLLDAIRNDPAARVELERLLAYLLDGASDNDAQTTTLMAAVDLLQVLDDDANLEPLYRVVANATSQHVVDPSGKVVQRGLVDGSVEALARIFARAYSSSGKEICANEIDPNHAIDFVLKRVLLPYGKDGKDLRTPIETILSVIGDVNRADPTQTSKLTGDDYKNIAKEISEFCLDPARGLVQVYEVVKQATKPKN